MKDSVRRLLVGIDGIEPREDVIDLWISFLREEIDGEPEVVYLDQAISAHLFLDGPWNYQSCSSPAGLVRAYEEVVDAWSPQNGKTFRQYLNRHRATFSADRPRDRRAWFVQKMKGDMPRPCRRAYGALYAEARVKGNRKE